MTVSRPVANIMQTYLQHFSLPGARQDAGLEVWFEYFGKEGENIEQHIVILQHVGLEGKLVTCIRSSGDEWLILRTTDELASFVSIISAATHNL
jgi:hypothetical protein